MQRANKLIVLGLVALLAITAGLYARALDGPWLFDDHVHITQNRWVKIESLSWENLLQAWHSSFSSFPSNRPLAQLSFGVNHALSGLDPWAFKTTNLVLHLLNGLAIFLFARLGYRALNGGTQTPQEMPFALLATAFWLIAPMHVSTVLYTVQRMAQISALATTLALASYIWGRLQMARGQHGLGWIMAVIPLGAVGFLGKENTVLLPLLLLTLELTLLQRLGGGGRNLLRFCWLILIALPLVAGLVYFMTHPGLVHYESRPFSLSERLLTEPRVLWFYLRLLLIPDVGRFGLYHDDFPISTGLLLPPTTLLAIGGLVAVFVAAVVFRSRYPMAAFAVLFFLSSHALESTFISLEIIFEHRNYLASLGPLMLLAYLIVHGGRLPRVGMAAMTLGALLLLAHGAATWVRVDNWSSYEKFVLNAADNHPASSRSNFMAAQFLMSMIANTRGDTSELESMAESFLEQGLQADPDCINCLFGQVVLALHVDRTPDPALLERLAQALRTSHVGATKVSISQFSYLVKWQQSDGVKIPRAAFEKLFDDALQNPRWPLTGRAGIEAAYRKYHEFVTGDLELALVHADRAIEAWPDQWSYHMHKVEVLRKLARPEAALQALEQAERLAAHDEQLSRVEQRRLQIMDGQGR